MDQPGLQEAWDGTHRHSPARDTPEDEVVAFAGRLQHELSPGASILDAGCGKGRHTLYLARLGLAVYACDLSPLAIVAASERLHQAGLAAGLQVADLRRLPYGDAQFSAALCVHVLPYHSWDGMVQVVRELERVLAPGGELYLDLLDRDDAEYGIGQEVEPHTFVDPAGVPTHYCSRQEVEELLHGLTPRRLARFAKSASAGAGLRVGWAVSLVLLKRRPANPKPAHSNPALSPYDNSALFQAYFSRATALKRPLCSGAARDADLTGLRKPVRSMLNTSSAELGQAGPDSIQRRLCAIIQVQLDRNLRTAQYVSSYMRPCSIITIPPWTQGKRFQKGGLLSWIRSAPTTSRCPAAHARPPCRASWHHWQRNAL